MKNNNSNGKNIVHEILSSMGIDTTISIDDLYVKDINAPLIEFVAKVREEHIDYSPFVNIFPEYFFIEDDEELWPRKLSEFLGGLTVQQKYDFYSLILEQGNGLTAEQDISDLTNLKSIIPDSVTLLTLTPRDWMDNNDKYVEKNSGILCLFDQDLQLDQLSENAGVILLNEAIEKYKGRNIAFGLLTHKIRTSEEVDVERISQFAVDNGLRLDQFIPLSKERLRGDPINFAAGLKLLWLNHVRSILTYHLEEASNDASKLARDRFRV
jgi:hypothetical protein